MTWRDQAACLGSDPNLFFSEAEAKVAEALAICGGCNVRDECLRDAIERGDKYGIRGGQVFRVSNGREHASHNKGKAGRPSTPIEHGTWAGYKKHLRRKEPMCEPCREASRNRGKDWAA